MTQADHCDQADRSWNRGQITFRLTAERLGRLRSIAQNLATDASVNDALDRAIDMAAHLGVSPQTNDPRIGAGANQGCPGPAEIAGKIEELQLTMASVKSLISQTIPRLADHINTVHSLITAATTDNGNGPQSFSTENLSEPPPQHLNLNDGTTSFGTWLNRQATALGFSIGKSAAVKAQRIYTSHDAKIAGGPLDFFCTLFALDNIRLDESASESTRSRIRLGWGSPSIPVSQLQRGAEVCLWCIPAMPEGWHVEAYLLREDGSLGAALGSFRI